jgi:hypothetical protein
VCHFSQRLASHTFFRSLEFLGNVSNKLKDISCLKIAVSAIIHDNPTFSASADRIHIKLMPFHAAARSLQPTMERETFNVCVAEKDCQAAT